MGPTSTSREQFWFDHFAVQESSGLSIKAYCLRHGLKMPTYYLWRKRLGLSPRSCSGGPLEVRSRSVDRGRSSEFVVVALPRSESSGGDAVEIVVPGGAMIRVSPGCHAEHFAMVWRVVSAGVAKESARTRLLATDEGKGANSC
jgi:hypothetical protein